MGFKCPICNKDFGTDKNDFNLHLKLHDEPVPDLAGLAFINSADTTKKILHGSYNFDVDAKNGVSKTHCGRKGQIICPVSKR